MFEPSHLVPNLNEIMEAYAESEEEAVQKNLLGALQNEERQETRAEIEKPAKETRKIKRGAEETEAEKS